MRSVQTDLIHSDSRPCCLNATATLHQVPERDGSGDNVGIGERERNHQLPGAVHGSQMQTGQPYKQYADNQQRKIQTMEATDGSNEGQRMGFHLNNEHSFECSDSRLNVARMQMLLIV